MAGIHAHDYHAPLTGSPTVTTPYSLTTLGCRNCPMMAASWRNLTLSAAGASGLSVFTASCRVLLEMDHMPLHTCPNCPDPNCSMMLHVCVCVCVCVCGGGGGWGGESDTVCLNNNIDITQFMCYTMNTTQRGRGIVLT